MCFSRFFQLKHIGCAILHVDKWIDKHLHAFVHTCIRTPEIQDLALSALDGALLNIGNMTEGMSGATALASTAKDGD
ncbi:uncharacterized protein V6R79_005843 [Siganus canaliculatus]